MILIIISVSLTILTMLGILVWCDDEGRSKTWVLCGLAWLLLILFGCFTNVKANSVGIMYNPFKGRNTR